MTPKESGTISNKGANIGLFFSTNDLLSNYLQLRHYFTLEKECLMA